MHGESTNCRHCLSRESMPLTGSNSGVKLGATTSRTCQWAKEDACPSGSTSGARQTAPQLLSPCCQAHAPTAACSAAASCKKHADIEYLEKVPLKTAELHQIDYTRRSMYKELQKDYDRRLSWARSLGIGTFSHFVFFYYHLYHASWDCVKVLTPRFSCRSIC